MTRRDLKKPDTIGLFLFHLGMRLRVPPIQTDAWPRLPEATLDLPSQELVKPEQRERNSGPTGLVVASCNERIAATVDNSRFERTGGSDAMERSVKNKCARGKRRAMLETTPLLANTNSYE
jgi:hypothetical protein